MSGLWNGIDQTGITPEQLRSGGGDPPVGEALYDLLPTIFRQADIAQGFPLKALMAVFELIRGELGDGVAELEMDWFIETCPLELVAAIGALVGQPVAAPVRPEYRALVADTLAVRRRKGIAAALPRLVRGNCGWAALYSPTPQTPAWSYPLPPASARAVQMPSMINLPPAQPVGWLRVWRLPVFARIGITPALGAVPRRYHFNPLGLEQPLFNIPNTSLGWEAAPAVTALPAAINGAMLAADIARYHADWPAAAQGPADTLLYGAARGLLVRSQTKGVWSSVPPWEVRAMALPDAAVPPPDYPVLAGGPIDSATLAGGDCALTVTLGAASADLTIAIPAQAGITVLANLLQQALIAAAVTGGSVAEKDAIHGLRAGAIGNALVVVPVALNRERLSIAPAANGADPLQLNGTAAAGIAVATMALDTAQITALSNAAAGSSLIFTAPQGQILTVNLPLKLPSEDAAWVAAAFAAALPECFVVAAGQQVVVVPPAAPGTAATQPPSALCWDLGLVPAVTIDPERGIFSWPSAWAMPDGFSVSYGAAMPARIGGPVIGPAPEPPHGAVMPPDGGSLDAQLRAWRAAAAAVGVLRMVGSHTRQCATTAIAPSAGQMLRVEADLGAHPLVMAASPGQIVLSGITTASATAAAPAIELAGFILGAGLILGDGALSLTLREMTLVPPAGVAAIGPPSGAVGVTAAAAVIVQASLLGQLDFVSPVGSASLADSIVAVLPVPDFKAVVLQGWAGMATELARVTVLGGAVFAGSLAAQDTLFAGALGCAGKTQFLHCALVDFSYGPDSGAGAADAETMQAAATVTRCVNCRGVRLVRLKNCIAERITLDPADGSLCQCGNPVDGLPSDCLGCDGTSCVQPCPLRVAGQAWQPFDGAMEFAGDNQYPLPGFGRLAGTDGVLQHGAGNRDQIGAFNLSLPAARQAQLEVALRDYLLFGVALEVVFDS